MSKRNQIVVGGPGSLESLKEWAKLKTSVWWSCGKDTKKGDFLFIYAMKPDSAIVATANAASNKRTNKKWRFVANIQNLHILERPITRAEMLSKIPEWGWPKQPRRVNYLQDPVVIRKLLKLANRGQTQAAEKTITIDATGAGFGTAEQNRKVELAACKEVRAHFEKKGYTVSSREKEKLGYDFDVSIKGKIWHLEVKGISGSEMRFLVTANELARARSDDRFQLAVVTNAVLPQKRVYVFARARFLKSFILKEIAYFAELKN